MSFAFLPEVQLDPTQSNLQKAHEDRHRNHDTSLIEGAAFSMLGYHKKLVGTCKEVYIKGARQLVERYNQKFEEKKRSQAILPFIFVEPSDLLVKNFKFQKGKNCLPIGRETTKWEKKVTHQKRIQG